MASETRRAARALVEHRVERFESRHPLGESQSRLATAITNARLQGRVEFSPAWISEGAATVLEAQFAPPARTQRFLKATSIAMSLLIGLTVWAVFSPSVEASAAWMLGLFTAFAILALPFVFVGLGSSREAEESRIRRAIRVALLDEDAKLPPQQRWKDED
jgi:hypothetical protein